MSQDKGWSPKFPKACQRMKAKKVVHCTIRLHDMTWYNSWQAGEKISKAFAVLRQSSETLEEKNSVLDSYGHTHTQN